MAYGLDQLGLEYDKSLENLYRKRKQSLAESLLAGTGMGYGSPAQYGYGELEAQRAGDVGAYIANEMSRQNQRAWQTGERTGAQDWQAAQQAAQRAWQTGERTGEQTWRASESALDRAAREKEFGRTFGLEQAKMMMDATGKIWSLDDKGEWKEGTGKTWKASEAEAERAARESEFGRTYGLERAKTMMDASGNVWTMDSSGNWAPTTEQTMAGKESGQRLAESLLKTNAAQREADMAAKLGFPSVEAMKVAQASMGENEWNDRVKRAYGKATTERVGHYTGPFAFLGRMRGIPDYYTEETKYSW